MSGRKGTNRKILRHTAQYLLAASLLALSVVPFSSLPAQAVSISDYYQYSYTIQFSKTQVTGNEIFYATAQASATCINSLPIKPNAVSFVGHVVASQSGGTEITLNSGYSLTISPFPITANQTTQISQTINLQFPAGSPSGTYAVTAKLDDARMIIAIGSISVMSFLPSTKSLGTVSYIADNSGGAAGGGGGGSTPTPTASQTPTPTPTATQTPTPTPTSTATPIPSPTTIPTPTSTPSSTPTASPAPTASPTPSPSATLSPTPTATTTPTPSPMPSPTLPASEAPTPIDWRIIGGIPVVLALWGLAAWLLVGLLRGH